MSRQRKKKGRPISGWVVLDKPVGIGSTECVSKIKWLYQAAKAGHAGTLDPLASGMLPVALGEATRTVPYVMDGIKTYRFQVTWGSETNTDDVEGEATQTSELRPSEEEVLAQLPAYCGEIDQVPPAYSAVKIDGERAYKRARDGETFEIASRKVQIEEIHLVSHEDGISEFEVTCGKGTYVRAIARDLGRDLKCYGHVSSLRRIAVGPFEEEDMITLEELCGLEGELEELDAVLFATAVGLEEFAEIPLTPDQVSKLRLGNPVILRGGDALAYADHAFGSFGDELVAIGEVDRGCFKPRRVFRHSGV